MNTKLLAAMSLAVLAALMPASAQNTFKLATTLTSSGSAAPAQIIATNFSGDGKVDLIGAGTVLTNSGKGIFNNALQFSPLTIRSNGFVAADVNRDGKMDLIALTNLTTSPYTESIVVYTNTGSSAFNGFSLGFYSSTTNVGNASLSGPNNGVGALASAGDVYGNGLVNLFYYNFPSNSVTLFTNSGSGTFGSNTTFGVKMSLPVSADVNRDGKMDFISYGYTNNLVYIYTNNGSGIFSSNAAFSVKAPTNLFTADVNGDGWVDLIVESVTNFNNNPSDPVTTLSVWTNNGSGTFGSNTSFTVGNIGERVMDLKAANLFGDANVHLALSVKDVLNNAGYLMIYTNNGTGGFGSNFVTANIGANLNPASLAVADLNGDGSLDLVSANYGNSGSLTVFTNSGNGIQSGSFVSNSVPVVGTNNFFVVAADLYHTGLPQLIVNGKTNTLIILTNNGSGMFGTNAVVSGFTANTFNNFVTAPPIAADIFGNGSPALIVGGWNTGNGQNWLTVLTNNGANVFGTNASYITGLLGYIPQQIVAADVNGDGKLDLIAVYSYGNTSWNITVLTNNGSGGFATNVSLTLNANPQLVVTDVNGDSRPDLIAAYSYSGYSYLTVFTNLSTTGASPFYSAAASHNYQITFGATPSSMVAADVNGDGKVDMIIANNNNPGTLSVMTNNGNGVFALASSPSVGAYPHAVTAADVNGDGKVDLISANWGLLTTNNDVHDPLGYGTLSVLTNNGAGIFTNPATFSVGKGPMAVIALDVNGDGEPDLIAANYTSYTNTYNSSPYSYGTGTTLSILLNTSNFVNTIALQTAPTDAPITYGQPLSAANINFAAGAVTNEAGVAVAGAFGFTTNSTNSILSAGTPNVPITFAATPPTDYQPITFNVSVTVTQLVAILKGSRAYDGTTNVVHNLLSVSNVVGSDFVVVNAGSVGMATANVGTNSITSTNGLVLAGTAAANYTLAGVTGAVIISKAVNTVLIYSSLNPSTYGASVNFTSTLPAYATGTMQFLTNGILFDTENLTGGSATSVATTSLPAGTTIIQAFYSGDANNLATTSYGLYQVVNAPQFNGVVLGAGGLVMSGSFGTPNGTYYILESTDLSLPVSQWTPVLTNQFDNNGNYNFTNPITATNLYFILQTH
jgi:hypothetical protein